MYSSGPIVTFRRGPGREAITESVLIDVSPPTFLIASAATIDITEPKFDHGITLVNVEQERDVKDLDERHVKDLSDRYVVCHVKWRSCECWR